MVIKTIKLISILCLLLQLVSCQDNSDKPISVSTDPCESVMPTPDSLRYFSVYEKPILEEPFNTDNLIFYSDEVVKIKWELPDNLNNTELQILELSNKYSCNDYGKFHLLNNNFSAGYGNQFVHNYFLNQYTKPITDSVFVAYRLRTTDISYPQKYSIWTNVKTFTMVPLTNLKKEVITVNYNFNFITEENNQEYYSGTLKKENYKLIDLANDYNLNYNKIKFIRPVKMLTNFITKFQNNRNPFLTVFVGFNEDFEINNTFYPFEVFGRVAPGSYQESPIEGQLYYPNSGNYISEMNQYDFKVAYKLEDVAGKNHQIAIAITYEVFSNY